MKANHEQVIARAKPLLYTIKRWWRPGWQAVCHRALRPRGTHTHTDTVPVVLQRTRLAQACSAPEDTPSSSLAGERFTERYAEPTCNAPTHLPRSAGGDAVALATRLRIRLVVWKGDAVAKGDRVVGLGVRVGEVVQGGVHAGERDRRATEVVPKTPIM